MSGANRRFVEMIDSNGKEIMVNSGKSDKPFNFFDLTEKEQAEQLKARDDAESLLYVKHWSTVISLDDFISTDITYTHKKRPSMKKHYMGACGVSYFSAYIISDGKFNGEYRVDYMCE